MSIKLSLDNFDETIQNTKGILLVDFHAEWCGPCKILGPVLDELEAEGYITLGKVDIDENPRLADLFQVSAVPTMVFFRDCQKIGQGVGVYTKDEIIEYLGRLELYDPYQQQ